MKCRQRSTATKRLIREVAIGARVDRQDKRWKVNQHSSLESANETASVLLEMSAKTVEWHRETGNVKDIADKNALSVEVVLGLQANLRESSKSKELAKLSLQVLVVAKANDACESKKGIIRLRE